MVNILVTPRKVSRLLFSIFAVLLCFNLVSNYLKWIKGFKTAFGFVPAFDFDNEYNIPSLFSVLLLLFSSLLLRYISFQKNKEPGSLFFFWKFLSYIFLYLAIDELASLHEALNKVVIYLLGYFEHINESRMWIIPYSLLVIILAVIFLQFLSKLPSYYRFRFIAAGFIYISGAIGVEIAGDQYMFNHTADFMYGLLATLEESLEMVGVILFIKYLIRYIAEYNTKDEIGLRFLIRKNAA